MQRKILDLHHRISKQVFWLRNQRKVYGMLARGRVLYAWGANPHRLILSCAAASYTFPFRSSVQSATCADYEHTILSESPLKQSHCFSWISLGTVENETYWIMHFILKLPERNSA